MLVEINNQANYKVDGRLVKTVVAKFAQAYRLKHKELSIAFIRQAEMKKLNRKYRGFKRTTDILSFAGEADFLGELIIDYNQVKKQAKLAGASIKKELIFILVHGLLHLIGYNDGTERGRLKMIKAAEKFIKNNL